MTEPLWLYLSLAAGTFVSEDASTFGAAALVSARELPAAAAIAWVGAGIWVGDVALFALGRLARRVGPVGRWIARRWPERELAVAASRLNRGAPAAILASRFLPGTRVALYVASGVLAVHPLVFMASTLVASALWTSAIVLGVSRMGAAVW